jgi:uncharacterized cupin superfamily protein
VSYAAIARQGDVMTRTKLWSVLAAAAFAPLAMAQSVTPTVPLRGLPSGVVPVEAASYHVPAFSNELVSVLNVLIPPHRESGYHRHSLDSVGVLISDTPRTGQVLGAQATVTAPRERGSANFTSYAREPLVHNVAVTGDVPFHNIVVALKFPTPGRFAAGARGQGYTQILDNERVRVWRLVLEPGQSAAAITQSAPGVRVVIDGGELVEVVEGRDRSMAPRSGEFFWQDAGTTRAVRNAGTTRIELVELELK